MDSAVDVVGVPSIGIGLIKFGVESSGFCFSEESKFFTLNEFDDIVVLTGVVR